MTKPQESIPPAADVLGTIGTICWCIQIIPQIWHNWRRKNTDGLPGIMLMLWAACAVPFGVYAIVQNFNLALKLQPQCFGGLTLITWGQTLYYHNKWRAWSATMATLATAALMGGTEAILIVTLRKPYYKGVEWPMMLMAITASVMQCVGLLLPYLEMAKRNGRVIGINFVFLTIDCTGAFFSLMALVAQHTFDALGGSMYIVCMALETGIFLSQAIWLWRVRYIRREAKKSGLTYDDYIAKYPSKKLAQSRLSKTFVDVEAAHTAITETPVLLEKCISRSSRANTDTDMMEITNHDVGDVNCISSPKEAAGNADSERNAVVSVPVSTTTPPASHARTPQ